MCTLSPEQQSLTFSFPPQGAAEGTHQLAATRFKLGDELLPGQHGVGVTGVTSGPLSPSSPAPMGSVICSTLRFTQPPPAPRAAAATVQLHELPQPPAPPPPWPRAAAAAVPLPTPPHPGLSAAPAAVRRRLPHLLAAAPERGRRVAPGSARHSADALQLPGLVHVSHVLLPVFVKLMFMAFIFFYTV